MFDYFELSKAHPKKKVIDMLPSGFSLLEAKHVTSSDLIEMIDEATVKHNQLDFRELELLSSLMEI